MKTQKEKMKLLCIKFKSIPEIWEKEKNGLKPNTVRKVDVTDKRFNYLKEFEKIIDSITKIRGSFIK